MHVQNIMRLVFWYLAVIMHTQLTGSGMYLVDMLEQHLWDYCTRPFIPAMTRRPFQIVYLPKRLLHKTVQQPFALYFAAITR